MYATLQKKFLQRKKKALLGHNIRHGRESIVYSMNDIWSSSTVLPITHIFGRWISSKVMGVISFNFCYQKDLTKLAIIRDYIIHYIQGVQTFRLITKIHTSGIAM